MEILKRLYKPDEAAIALNLRLRPEEPTTIAARMGQDENELAQKGLAPRKPSLWPHVKT